MVESLFRDYTELIKEYIAFQTISTVDSSFEIQKAVEWLNKLFKEEGFESEVIVGFDNPVIFSQKFVNKSFPTILIYGHYDVQPASKKEWGTDPFRLVRRNGRYYARGIVDNKGQMLIHLVTVLNLLKTDLIKYNIKFLIEGNEETGSPNISKLLEQYKEKLKSDFILISDSALIKDHPTMEMSLRGVFNTSLTIKTSNKDLHSGLFGGVIPNSAQVASDFISGLKDSNGFVMIDGFYDNVAEVDKRKLDLTKSIPFDKNAILELTGAKNILLESGQNYYSQIGLRPTFEVTGIESGYTGAGYRNSIPYQTKIKFNFRLVSNQTPEEILTKFKKYTEEKLPNFVEFEFAKPDKTEGTVRPIMLNANNPFTRKAKEILQEVYDKEVLYDFNGATLPIVVKIIEILKADLLMVALANEDCNMHAVDENFDLQTLKKALQFSYKFLST